MQCPRCRQVFDILAFERMAEVEAFQHETNPIYKCSKKAVSLEGKTGCSWIFSPAEEAVLKAMISPSRGR